MTQAKTLLSTGYADVLGDLQHLSTYWENMSRHLDDPPDPDYWGCTVPYCLWGDEGTIQNSGSWMFGTLSLGYLRLCNALYNHLSVGK